MGLKVKRGPAVPLLQCKVLREAVAPDVWILVKPIEVLFVLEEVKGFVLSPFHIRRKALLEHRSRLAVESFILFVTKNGECSIYFWFTKLTGELCSSMLLFLMTARASGVGGHG